MAEWVVCGQCQLKHARRPDAYCPRCHQPIPPSDAELGAAAQRPSFLESIGTTGGDAVSDEVRLRGRLDLMLGAAILLIGGVVTAVTYQAAPPGGSYVLATGAFLFGGLRIVRGLVRVTTGRPSRFWDVKL